MKTNLKPMPDFQKSLFGTGSLKFIFEQIPGVYLKELPSGCCGMAGLFGYEKEHYAISKKKMVKTDCSLQSEKELLMLLSLQVVLVVDIKLEILQRRKQCIGWNYWG